MASSGLAGPRGNTSLLELQPTLQSVLVKGLGSSDVQTGHCTCPAQGVSDPICCNASLLSVDGLCVCVCVSLHVCVFSAMQLSVCPQLWRCVCKCLHTSDCLHSSECLCFCVCVSLFLSVHLCVSLSLSIGLRGCPSRSMHLCIFACLFACV